MSLSQNIRKYRIEKSYTQEQLAAILDISAQAVSKWETSETYPDGSLLVPLANALDVSLDTLFGNTTANMSEISSRIQQLFLDTPPEEHFHTARDLGWQIERGMFNCLMTLDEKYDPDELKNLRNSSYILNDHGFTIISNGSAPFFSVFPEPKDGFLSAIKDGEEMRQVFQLLSSPETMRAILFLHGQKDGYVFESALLAAECQIEPELLSDAINNLLILGLITQKELEINGEKCTLYTSNPSHKLIALLLLTHELNYQGAYTLQAIHRKKPYL